MRLGHGVCPVRQRVVRDLVDLGCQREHIPPAKCYRRATGSFVRRHAVVSVVLLHPAVQLLRGIPLKPDRLQQFGQPAKQCRRIARQVSRIQRIRTDRQNQQDIRVFRQYRQCAEQSFGVGGAERVEVDSRDGYQLALRAHGRRRHGVQQTGGGQIQPVQPQGIEGCHGVIGGAYSVLHHTQERQLHVILLAEKQVAAPWRFRLQCTAEICLAQKIQCFVRSFCFCFCLCHGCGSPLLYQTVSDSIAYCITSARRWQGEKAK